MFSLSSNLCFQLPLGIPICISQMQLKLNISKIKLWQSVTNFTNTYTSLFSVTPTYYSVSENSLIQIHLRAITKLPFFMSLLKILQQLWNYYQLKSTLLVLTFKDPICFKVIFLPTHTPMLQVSLPNIPLFLCHNYSCIYILLFAWQNSPINFPNPWLFKSYPSYRPTFSDTDCSFSISTELGETPNTHTPPDTEVCSYLSRYLPYYRVLDSKQGSYLLHLQILKYFVENKIIGEMFLLNSVFYF